MIDRIFLGIIKIEHMELFVYYGLRKLTKKVIRRPSIIVIFENYAYWKNEQYVNRAMKVLHKRLQTKKEMEDGMHCNRCLTFFEIFLDDRQVKWDVERAIEVNFQSDSNNVSLKERIEIADKIREDIYRFYDLKPKVKHQLELF